MVFVVDRVLKGNRREVPGNLPPLLWADKVDEYAGSRWMEVPFYVPEMEYLDLQEFRRVKAKALIWWEITGEWPSEIAWWWEVRNARRRGALPHTNETAPTVVDEDGVLHCGFCEARWSFPYPDRCKLCDRVLEDAPIPA